MSVAGESPKGLGQVYKTEQYVADVIYRFAKREEVDAWGYVQILRAALDQLSYGDELTLCLDDGRRIDIVVKTWDFNSKEYLFVAKSAAV